MAPRASQPKAPTTLTIDIGGTGLKASVLDASGVMLTDRARIATTYPVAPSEMIAQLAALVAPLPAFDRISVGFPGVVRNGHVLTAPHFVTVGGPGTKVDRSLVAKWTGFDLAAGLAQQLAKSCRVLNDADLQALDVVKGSGVEVVITLGTGFGTAFAAGGRLGSHLELSQHPFRKGETYDEQLGDAARKRVGNQKWNRRLKGAIATLDTLFTFDHLYIGGGNATSR
jgi:polyphosphate glucokinase